MTFLGVIKVKSTSLLDRITASVCSMCLWTDDHKQSWCGAMPRVKL